MKLSSAIESGLTGASTLTLLQEALHTIDPKSPRPLLHKSGLIKRIRKNKFRNGTKGNKLYVELATELLTNALAFGLAGLGKKKNAVLRGGVLGAAAGLGAAFLPDQEHDKPNVHDGTPIHGRSRGKHDEWLNKLITVSLYTAGGLLAGAAVKNAGKLKKKGKKMLKKRK